MCLARSRDGLMADKIKLVLAALLLAAGVAGFYYLGDSAAIVRLGAIVAGAAAGIAVAWFTAPGQQFLVFSRDAMTEVKKVVWPTRKESLQTAGIVFAFVLVMALFLWLSDKTLEYLLYDLVLGWKKS
jgi:preprotein translocase subunit SecE